jgi:predicted alpha/beta superfamily hydrolase
MVTPGMGTGKGAQFFNFIGGELIPYLEKNIPQHRLEIIAGHDSTAGFLKLFFCTKKE